MENLTTSIVLALIGGALIGVSSSLNYILFGKITGLSGYLFRVFSLKFDPIYSSTFCFIIGLITAVDTYYRLIGSTLYGLALVDTESSFNPILIVIGSFLVGFGVRWGGGCTSGHGVCGLPRLSIRSFIAVPTFMASGIVTASLLNLLGPIAPQVSIPSSVLTPYSYFPIILLHLSQAAALSSILYTLFTEKTIIKRLAPLIYLSTGLTFGLGLLISGMCSRSKILNFLTISSNWDPSLIFVMCSAVAINFITFQLVMRRNRAVFSDTIDLPDKHIDKGIFFGPIVFGIGWGTTGFCPGPALANITVLSFGVVMVVFIFSGQLLFDYLDEKFTQQSSQKEKLLVSPNS